MTCVIFAKRGRTLYTCADGRVCADDDILTECDGKVFIKGDVAIAGAGESSLCVRVETTVKEAKCAGLSQVIRIISDQVYRWRERDVEAGAIWMLSTPATGTPILLIDSNASVVDTGQSYYAIGSGAPYAMGYMAGRTPCERTMRAAIGCAARYKSTVGPVYWYKEII